MKKIGSIIILSFVFLLSLSVFLPKNTDAGVISAYKAVVDYTPSCNVNSCKFKFLATLPIPGVSSTGEYELGKSGASAYIKALYTFGVGIAAGLALIMIVIGGIQYSSTDAITGKDAGKERITAALSGLALALLSYLILATINTSLLSTDITPATIAVDPGVAAGGQTQTPGTGTGGTGVTPGAPNGQTGTINPNPGGGASNLNNNNVDYGTRLSNGGRVTRFGGRDDLTTSENETGSVSHERLRSLDPSTDLYAAYPLSGHSIPGLPDRPNTGTENQRLNNQVVKVNLMNGQSVSLRIIDRGPGAGNNFDVSSSADKAIYDGGGIRSLELINK